MKALWLGGSIYALFEDDKQIGSAFPTEREVWEAALMGLVMDVQVRMKQAASSRIPRRAGRRILRSSTGLDVSKRHFLKLLKSAGVTRSSRLPSRSPRAQ